MIKYKIGDLLEAANNGEVMAIAHCCNCQVNMGSGIAPQIKWAFPYAWKADQETTRGDWSKLGTYSLGDPSDEGYDGPLVYNLYGQFGYGKRNQGGRDLDYNALYNSLLAMAQDLDRFDCGDFEAMPVGLPLIGCGLAGGDWEIVEKMIERTLCAVGHSVTVYIRNEKEIPESVSITED